MSEARIEWIESFDGTRLVIQRVGQGRPVLLLHGLFSNAHTNWIKFGHAAKLAEAGLEAIMPDLRAHGDMLKNTKLQAAREYHREPPLVEVVVLVLGLIHAGAGCAPKEGP